VYSRRINNSDYTFGVSGRLYNSNVLMYDHQTESLWSQLMDTAISGPLAGTVLQKLPAKRVRWSRWKKQHPTTRVLSTDTGYQRDYWRDPYAGYYLVGSLMFPVGDVRRDLPAKARVLGITIANESRAYPLESLTRHTGSLQDRLGGTSVRIEIDADGQVIDVVDAEGKPVVHLFAYWFAWQAFHPDTTVYAASD
jgi:hypothetical protein